MERTLDYIRAMIIALFAGCIVFMTLLGSFGTLTEGFLEGLLERDSSISVLILLVVTGAGVSAVAYWCNKKHGVAKFTILCFIWCFLGFSFGISLSILIVTVASLAGAFAGAYWYNRKEWVAAFTIWYFLWCSLGFPFVFAFVDDFPEGGFLIWMAVGIAIVGLGTFLRELKGVQLRSERDQIIQDDEAARDEYHLATDHRKALAAAAERYAKGEISKDEYENIKASL